jgi:hypothetical protein
MESEEFEEIPWASLVAKQADGIDKRIYLAVGIVGVLVVALLGMRLLSGSPQPVAPPAVIAEDPPVMIVESTPPTSMVIAEADLRAEEPPTAQANDRLVEVTAEWFVIDWYTRDGSDETVRSIKASISPDLAFEAIPHETADEPVTFVEWAKTIETEVMPNGETKVTVAYRAIRETAEGFVRDPVVTVILSVVRTGSLVTVDSLPNTEN